MPSLPLLVATTVLAVVASAHLFSLPQGPTTRDRTAECKRMTDFAADEATKCGLFNLCCRVPDPLNGDKCQYMSRMCQANGEGELVFSCVYANCTEVITATTETITATTPSLPPPQINAASVKGASSVHSAYVSASVLLPLAFHIISH